MSGAPKMTIELSHDEAAVVLKAIRREQHWLWDSDATLIRAALDRPSWDDGPRHTRHMMLAALVEKLPPANSGTGGPTVATEPTAEQRATTLWVERPPGAKPSEMIDYIAATIRAAEDAARADQFRRDCAAVCHGCRKEKPMYGSRHGTVDWGQSCAAHAIRAAFAREREGPTDGK